MLLRCYPRQPPPVTQPWLHTDCWRGFKPLVPSDKRFNHSKVWCTFISSSTSTVYAVQVCECYNINSYWYFYFLKYNTLGLQYCITTTLLYFTTVLHLLHLLHLSISSDRCNRCNPIVLQYCCCCEGGDCCCMNECYNIVVAVKVATAVVWTSATILTVIGIFIF